MPKLSSMLAVALCGMLFAACGGGASSSPKATPTSVDPPSPTITIAAGQPIVIGLSAALTGVQATLGTDLADTAELAANDRGGAIKGHPVKVERADDGCGEAEKAVRAARTLIATSGIVGVIGPMCTMGAQAANPLYEAAGLVHISPSITRTDLSAQGERYFFRVAWRDDEQAVVQSQYATDTLHARSVALIDDGSPYAKELADAFAAAFQRSGGDVLSRDRIDPAATDFATLAKRVQGETPDAVVFEGLNPAGVLLLKALHEAQYTAAFIAPDGVLSLHDFVGAGGSTVEGAFLTGGPMPSELFVAHFQERYHRAPATPFVLQTHDAVIALLTAIESVAVEQNGQLVIDRAKLADALRRQSMTGFTGPIQFDENGDRRTDAPGGAGIIVYRVTNGRFVPVP
ncbi:MAG: branched-chain amino acid ABC transporter substrate-binding protein [Dehalococcoidia bacterium]|nr:MAG: branched-chain amino acid ABC transporter substrate-binding protein [Dehalococcoidia bacterium]